MARGKYVVKTGSSGLYRFNLYASNGRVVATSRSFPSAQSCLRGMQALQASCGAAALRINPWPVIQKKNLPNLSCTWTGPGNSVSASVLQAEKILISSEGYLSKSNCLRGIRSVCRHAPLADLLWEE